MRTQVFLVEFQRYKEFKLNTFQLLCVSDCFTLELSSGQIFIFQKIPENGRRMIYEYTKLFFWD